MFNILQNWVNISGTLQLKKIRDNAIRILSSVSINENLDSLTQKNIQAYKVLTNISHCLGSKDTFSFLDLMDTNSWFIIFQTMQNFEGLSQDKQRSKEE